MYKLVIVFFQPLKTPESFAMGWQKFLSLAEKMPGLRKEVVSDLEQVLFGPPSLQFKKMHELHFDSRDDLEAALASDAGQKAGQWLQSFAQGQFVLSISRHMEATPNEFKKT